MEYDEECRPKISVPKAKQPSARDLFRRRLYLLGITEQDRVEKLWREREAELKAEKAKSRSHE